LQGGSKPVSPVGKSPVDPLYLAGSVPCGKAAPNMLVTSIGKSSAFAGVIEERDQLRG